MREIDKKLAEALKADDESLFDVHANEQSLFAEVADTFRGKRRWMVALVWFWSFLIFAVRCSRRCGSSRQKPIAA
ncbi:MAG: hypothetical protein K8E66_03580 [Phycisphaerales bacterium]|nr:hypothetical protein [Phycisphaerales bacterium]